MKGVVPVLLVVILSVLYDTNGLTLNDFYPYGQEHGDTARTGSDPPTAPLLEPINNFIVFGSVGLTATRYKVLINGFLRLQPISSAFVNFLVMYRYNLYSTSQSKVYGRVTNDPGLLRRAMNNINGAFPYTYCSPPTQLIIATWIDYQKTNTRQGSNFQLVIVTNGQATFGIAQFVNVDESPTESDRAGIYSNALGSFAYYTAFDLPYASNPESAPNEMLNSDIPGTYIFPLNADCQATKVCQCRIIGLACESLRQRGETVPASCN